MTRARQGRRAAACATLAALVAAPLAGGRDEPAVVREAYLMGTRVTLASRGEHGAALAALERMLGGLEAAEAELSTWREDTALGRLNRQPVDEQVPAPEAVCDLLRELLDWHGATAGSFDPGVGALVEAWGLRSGGRRPSAPELERARASSGLRRLELEAAPCRITRRAGVVLDSGGFGKGAALDRVADVERRHRAAGWMIDLGGQVGVGASDGAAWSVAIAHPARRGEAALELRLESGSLATSGGSERDVVVDGTRLGHILDPRSGRPVSRNASVTVWHSRGLVADVLSTALYVMGVDEGLAWAEARGIAACFLVAPAGAPVSVRATPRFRERFFGTGDGSRSSRRALGRVPD